MSFKINSSNSNKRRRRRRSTTTTTTNTTTSGSTTNTTTSESTTNSTSGSTTNTTTSESTTNTTTIIKDFPFDKIYELNEDASVSLYGLVSETSGATCSGFFINYIDPNGNKGYIVTAAHCVLVGNREQVIPNMYGTVTNVNGTGVDKVYRMKIIGVDASNDIAVLHPISDDGTYIDLNNQISMSFGKSRSVKIGSMATIIGNPAGLDQQSLTFGIVRDNMHTIYFGSQPCESILTDSSISSGNSGSPILDSNGLVIGILSFGYGGNIDDLNGGPAQYVVQPIVERIINGMGKESEWTDSKGNYSKKGFLGIRYTAVSIPQIINWDGIGTWSRKGVYVSSSRHSELVGKILISINDIIIGDIQGQVAPGSITSLLKSGTEVKIVYVNPKENLNNEKEISIVLDPFPLENDVPLTSSMNV